MANWTGRHLADWKDYQFLTKERRDPKMRDWKSSLDRANS